MRETAVERLLKHHLIRRIIAAETLDWLKTPSIRVAAGTVSAATSLLEPVARRLALVSRQVSSQVSSQVSEANCKIDHLTVRLADGEAPSDVTILRSFPGVGRIVLATLLAEAQDALHQEDRHALRRLSGVARITKRSGNSKIVLMRRASQVCPRNAV